MSQTKLISLDNLTRYDGKIKELIGNGDTTYSLSAGTGADANKIVLTPSTGNPDKVTVPYATNSGTVNGKTVESNVPANAVFTDTTYTAATSAPGDIASAGSVGTSTDYARQDHTHGIVVATGDSVGQVKVAGQNVTVNGFNNKQDDLGLSIVNGQLCVTYSTT